MGILSPELLAFLKPGLAGTIVAADEARRPQTARVWAARHLEGGDVVELYLLRGGSVGFLDNVARSGRAAANLVEVSTYRSRAFKGRCTVSERGIDPVFLDACLYAMNAEFERVGLAKAVERMLGHFAAPRDMAGVLLDVDSVFDQSPKPGAGGRLVPPGPEL